MPESGTCTSIINLRYQDGSEGSASNPAKYNRQDFGQLRQRWSGRGGLFVDNTFPPNRRSLGALPSFGPNRSGHVEWLRPAELLKRQKNDSEPVFVPKDVSRFDFGQGCISNCWFLSAITSLTFNQHLLEQVVPMDQNFHNHGGIFHFRFWRFGKWVDVVVDDLLPTMDNSLLSVHCKGENVFWVPLLEKAYAKVCGSYNDMNIGLPSEAFKDFSGGVTMTYDLGGAHDDHVAHSDDHDEDLWLALGRATGCRSMICCGTPNTEDAMNGVARSGLVIGHAYSVTGVTEVELDGAQVRLVRIMNPWGAQEWNGRWADWSDLWKRVKLEDREKRSSRHDGEFWMQLEDFCHNFMLVSMSCENPNFIDGDVTCQWKCMSYDGGWVAGDSAGGAVSYTTFYTNPQYRIQVSIIDRTEAEDNNVLLSLMQKPTTNNRLQDSFHPFGLSVYPVPPGTPSGRLGTAFFSANRPVKETEYTFNRDLIVLLSLEPGEYVIVPSTERPYMSADFVLSVYTKAEAKISAHDHHHDDDDEHDHGNSKRPLSTHDHHDDDDDEHDHGNSKRPQNGHKPSAEDSADASMRSLFERYTDQNGELMPTQLQRLLKENFPHGSRYGFGVTTCRSLMAQVDLDQRMTMTFAEFSLLWSKMNEYKKLFYRSDLQKTGSLTDEELKSAIRSKGLSVDDYTVKRMIFRYSDPSSTSMKNFVVLMMNLENSSAVFNKKSQDGTIQLSWEEWSIISMYK